MPLESTLCFQQHCWYTCCLGRQFIATLFKMCGTYTLFLKTLSQQEFIQFAFSRSHFNFLPTTRVCKHSVAVHQLYRSLWFGRWVSLRCHFDNSDCISPVLLFFFDSIQNSIKFLSENRYCSSYRSLSFQEWFWMTEERIWSNVFPLRSHVCVF